MENVDKKSKIVWMLHQLVSFFIKGGITGTLYYILHDHIKASGILLLYIGYQVINVLYKIVIHNRLHYKNSKYQLDETDLYLYDGGLTVTESVIPYRRIQHLQSSQDYISRLFGLYSLSVQTAGSHFTIEYVSKEKTEDLKKRLIDQFKEEDEGIDLS